MTSGNRLLEHNSEKTTVTTLISPVSSSLYHINTHAPLCGQSGRKTLDIGAHRLISPKVVAVYHSLEA